MTKLKKIDQETLKNLNMQIILNHIHIHKEISRIDLAQYTKLSPSTVSVLTSELIKGRIVNEIRAGESNGGRRPIMLGISSDAKYVITIIMTHKGAKYSLINLNCEKIDERQVLRENISDQAVIGCLYDCIKDMGESHAEEMKKVCGIGISLPGVIDHEDGKVLYSSKLHLENFDLSSIIKERTGLDCYIYKDTDALILGEHKFGAGAGYNNFVYVIVENGVGMSYINSERLFKPGYGGGFELGHITIDSNGPTCLCGNRGCLGTMVSENAILSRLEKLVEKGIKTSIKSIDHLAIADVVELSNKGDRAAMYVLEEQAKLLGIALASVVNILNPQMVAIGGPLSKCSWGFKELLSDVVRDRALEIYSRNVKIDFAKLGDDSALLGMADDIYEKVIFKPVELY